MRARSRGVNFPRNKMARFSSYDARKLLSPAMIARAEIQFRLPAERTQVQSDFHYRTTETPNGLGARSCQP
jgi:hypothetical protein